MTQNMGATGMGNTQYGNQQNYGYNSGYQQPMKTTQQNAQQHQDFQDVAMKRDPNRFANQNNMNPQNNPNLQGKNVFNLDQATQKAMEKVDPDGINYKFFYVSVSGVVESGECASENYLQCRYEIVTGPDWEKVEGQYSGCSQQATATSHLSRSLVWNFPFDCTFRSLNPYGWPQLVLTVMGPDFFGRSVVKGYGSVHIPTTPGFHERTVYLYKPIPMSLFSGIFGYLKGKMAEYETPTKLIAKGEGREVTRVETTGKVKIKFQISEKGMKKFGYM